MAILKSVGLFAEISESILEHIAAVLTTTRLSKGETLFKKGDFDFALYMVVEGKVKAHVENHTFAVFGPTQYFGEYSLLDSSPRSTTVTAVENTRLLKLDQRNFFTFLDNVPSMSRAMLKGLVWRLRDYNILEAELTAKNAEIKRQKEELEVQRKELEALNSTKDKFFAIIAHDLKNPFSTVLGLSELLAREFENFEPDKLKTFIQQIYKYSNNTFNLLENLLQWSMVQTGRMPLHPKTTNLNEILEENIELLRGTASQKGISIIRADNLDCFAYIDTNMITTVVRNLISNAIKFTPAEGSIKAGIVMDDEYWKIYIRDNGLGIAKEDQEKLFKIDSNPTTIGTSQEKGTGLGLILCKEFVERNGGQIWVESEKGKGSTFYFTLPRVGGSAGNITV